MERREGQARRAAHGAAAQENLSGPIPLFYLFDNLYQVRLGPGPHPRGFRPVVRRDENHPVVAGGVAGRPALIARVMDKLPAIGAMPVQGDKHIAGRGIFQRLRCKDDIPLGGPVAARGKGYVLDMVPRDLRLAGCP
ncbi:MAG: hypothetical protein BWX80_01053 [Candidatus Hydrogenedentes bacterium ADurb.Bin101]|nr:MAG: hypothetical protein BWX80_01053 [Candidatus Hydrogenedentes bacterium ADurb.Bin101]